MNIIKMSNILAYLLRIPWAKYNYVIVQIYSTVRYILYLHMISACAIKHAKENTGIDVTRDSHCSFVA